MIAWLVGIITFILLLFMLWRMRSKTFRERCERPKFKFLENLGEESQNLDHDSIKDISQEDANGKRNS